MFSSLSPSEFCSYLVHLVKKLTRRARGISRVDGEVSVGPKLGLYPRFEHYLARKRNYLKKMRRKSRKRNRWKVIRRRGRISPSDMVKLGVGSEERLICKDLFATEETRFGTSSLKMISRLIDSRTVEESVTPGVRCSALILLSPQPNRSFASDSSSTSRNDL